MGFPEERSFPFFRDFLARIWRKKEYFAILREWMIRVHDPRKNNFYCTLFGFWFRPMFVWSKAMERPVTKTTLVSIFCSRNCSKVFEQWEFVTLISIDLNTQWDRLRRIWLKLIFYWHLYYIIVLYTIHFCIKTLKLFESRYSSDSRREIRKCKSSKITGRVHFVDTLLSRFTHTNYLKLIHFAAGHHGNEVPREEKLKHPWCIEFRENPLNFGTYTMKKFEYANQSNLHFYCRTN